MSGANRPAAINHRVRTAAERRERMRAHLIRTALALLAEQGMTSHLIDDLIKAAGVSRGTFYNYFRSPEALLEAISTAISSELLRQVDPVVLVQPDAAARVCCGVRLCLLAGLADRQLAAFISRGGPAALHQSGPLASSLCRDLADGIRSGLFTIQDAGLAFDLVIGPVLAAYHRLAAGTADNGYIDNLAASVLLALGVNHNVARQLSQQSLPTLDWQQTSLLTSATAMTERRASR